MSTPAVAPPASEGLSQGARAANMFFAPSKTFRDLNRSAAWWLPFIIMAVVGLFFVYAVDKKIGFDRVAENQVRLNARAADQLDQLPPDQRAQRMEFSAKLTRTISYCTPVIQIIFLLLTSLILWGSFSFGAGAQISFGKTMAVVTYANLVGIVKYLVAIIALYAGAAGDSFNMQNPAATNLGVLFDPTQQKVLYALGTQLDIVVFWVLALAALGFTYVCKVKKGTSFAIVFGWWLVVVLVSVGAAAAFS